MTTSLYLIVTWRHCLYICYCHVTSRLYMLLLDSRVGRARRSDEYRHSRRQSHCPFIVCHRKDHPPADQLLHRLPGRQWPHHRGGLHAVLHALPTRRQKLATRRDSLRPVAVHWLHCLSVQYLYCLLYHHRPLLFRQDTGQISQLAYWTKGQHSFTGRQNWIVKHLRPFPHKTCPPNEVKLICSQAGSVLNVWRFNICSPAAIFIALLDFIAWYILNKCDSLNIDPAAHWEKDYVPMGNKICRVKFTLCHRNCMECGVY